MDEFQQELADIIELEEEVRLAPSYQFGEPWVQDRIQELTFRYRHLIRWWPIVPGRGTRFERGIEC